MHLKSLKIKNFRKFGTENNTVEFVDSKDYLKQQEGKNTNIAPITTLIVGKNNSGKTTITKALHKLVNTNKFCANDFNFRYLSRLLEEYKNEIYKELPLLEFEVIVGFANESSDLITFLFPFMNIENVYASELQIFVKYELKESTSFIEDLKEIIKNNTDRNMCFTKYLELIEKSDFKLNYYDINGDVKEQFKISDLIDLKLVNANKILNDTSLSKSFNKIIKYRYESDLKKPDKEKLDKSIIDINDTVTNQISDTHTKYINDALDKIESSDRLKISLSSDLNFEKLLSNLIKYEYKEDEFNIPESQFGLGYSNLMTIIAELIDYIEQYREQTFHSKINLISIEEPEAFMHPQMQEQFIKHINDAISFLLNNGNKNINSQLIITTHSSHILNSKIHSGNTFNNISYITIVDNYSNVVNLNDVKLVDELSSSTEKANQNSNKLSPNTETINLNDSKSIEELSLIAKKKERDLKFIKKHIKYKVSELFFSDAVIFVEGITEETLLYYYIDNYPKLNKYYISIFNINGAHGLVYHNLIKLLKVPTLIFTDLDIKRSDEEKEETDQINSLNGKITTNETIKKYNNSDDLSEISEKFSIDNLYIAFQSTLISGYYATSFEEALILTNFSNKCLNLVLEKLKPTIYKKIVGEPRDILKLKENSYKLQKKLSKSKSDFANELLYECISNCNEENPLPNLPDYILNGLKWLEERLNP